MITFQEAIKRMKRRGTKSIRWTFPDKQIEYQYIPSNLMRNYDGSSAGSGEDPNKIVLQQKVWRNGDHPRFSNLHC
jgi:hypothetical protein